MPEISIDSTRENIGYGLKAENIFWCAHGILWKTQLRDSEDEEMIADIVASIIHDKPIARSRELFDKMYEAENEENTSLNTKIVTYGVDRIIHEIKVTFSILQKIFEEAGTSIRGAVSPRSTNPVKGSFFALFMAVFKLVVKDEQSPDQSDKIVRAVNKLQTTMISTAKYSTTDDRQKNIDKTIGLIQPYFVKKDPPVLRHGSGLAMDLENSIRRSKVETNRYECKQGFVDLSEKRIINEKLYDVIINTICGIANIGPESDGYIFIGVTDKIDDAEKVKNLDKITPIDINGRFVVGIERELTYMSCDIETYVRRLVEKISSSTLTDPLKSQLLSQIDVIEYKKLTIIRIRVPKQTSLSYVGEKAYIREGSETKEITGPKLVAINKLFI